MLLRVSFLGNEAEEPLLCLVVSTVGYPEDMFAILNQGVSASALLTCAEDTDVGFS